MSTEANTSVRTDVQHFPLRVFVLILGATWLTGLFASVFSHLAFLESAVPACSAPGGGALTATLAGMPAAKVGVFLFAGLLLLAVAWGAGRREETLRLVAGLSLAGALIAGAVSAVLGVHLIRAGSGHLPSWLANGAAFLGLGMLLARRREPLSQLPGLSLAVGRRLLGSRAGVTWAAGAVALLLLLPRALPSSAQPRQFTQADFDDRLLRSEEGKRMLAARMEAARDPKVRALRDARAKVTLTVFSDFACFGCRQIHLAYAQALAALHQDLGDAIATRQRQFPLDDRCNTLAGTVPRHPSACLAAELLVLAREQNQPGIADWLYNVPPTMPEPQMLAAAAKFGLLLDPGRRERAARVVAEDIDLARSVGMTKLPALYVNDIVLPPVSVPVLRAIVDQELRNETAPDRRPQ